MEHRSPSGSGSGTPLVTRADLPALTTPCAAPAERPAVPADVAIGSEFGRYVLLRRVGAGGMGAVYEAFDPELDRRVAVKILQVRGAGKLAARARRILEQRLVREAKALAKLSHPHVVAVFDVGVIEGRPFIAMELVDGQPLDRWLRRKPQRWQDAIDPVLQAALGLCAVHEAGLVHRDFKPANIMVGSDGRVRVLDFGLVKLDEVEHDQTSIPTPWQVTESGTDELTRVGDVLGTPSYIAPELHAGCPADSKSDQFALAVTLFEACYGRRPFRARGLSEIARKVAGGRVDVPADRRSVPDWLHAIVMRGLSVDPGHRFASVDRMLSAIDRHRHRRAWWQRRVTAVATAVGVACVCGVGLTAAAHEPCPSPDSRWHGVWDASQRASVRASFSGTEAPYAARAVEAVEIGLNSYVERWSRGHREACQATRVDARQSDVDLDLRMACLGQAHAAVSTLVDEFTRVDRRLVRKAQAALDSLPNLDECEDVEALRASAGGRLDSDQLAEHRSLAAGHASVHTLYSAGRYAAGIERGERLVARARASGLPGMEAQLRVLIGLVRRTLADNIGAIDDHERALVLAVKSGRRDVAARAAVELMYERSYLAGNFAAGWTAIPEIEARLSAIGNPTDLVAIFSRYRAILLGISGRHRESEQMFQTAYEQFRERHGDAHPRVGMALSNMAAARYFQHDYAGAAELFRRSGQIQARASGWDHPLMIQHHRNLGSTLLEAGDFRGAHESFGRAHELCQRNAGHEHLACALTGYRLAEGASALGRRDRALRRLKAVERIQSRAGARGDATTPWAEQLIARIHLRAGRCSAARDSIARLADKPGTKTPDLARLEAMAEFRCGNPELALSAIQVAIAEEGREAMDAGARREARLELAEIQLSLGRATDAAETIEAAQQAWRAAYPSDNPNLSRFYRTRSRVRARLGQWSAAEDDARARVLALQSALGSHAARVREAKRDLRAIVSRQLHELAD